MSLPNLQSEVQPKSTVEIHHVEVEFEEKGKTCSKGMKTLASATKGRGNGHGHRYCHMFIGMTFIFPFYLICNCIYQWVLHQAL